MASGNLGPVYLKIGQRVRRARHVELSFEGIQKAFEDTFGIAEHNIAARIGDFRLRVPPGVWVTDFDPVTDVKPFSVIEWCIVDSQEAALLENDALLRYEALLAESLSPADPASHSWEGEGLKRMHSKTSGALDRGRIHEYDNLRGVITAVDAKALPPWRAALLEFLDDPSSSFLARMWTYFLLGVIFLSTVTFCLESIPGFSRQADSRSSAWYALEASATAVFTVEILARLIAYGDLWQYLKRFMNLVDVAAVLPFYIELIVQAVIKSSRIPGLQVLRVIRLIRIFRLFKASRASLMVLRDTMVLSARPLYMLVFLVALGLTVFSSVIYYAERGIFDDTLQAFKIQTGYYCTVAVSTGSASTPLTDSWVSQKHPGCALTSVDSGSSTSGTMTCQSLYEIRWTPATCHPIYELTLFTSIPASLWWCIVTMVTVGYGDLVPHTPAGKIIASLVILFGILVLAMPISVIGANFTIVYQRKLKADKLKQMMRKQKRAAKAGSFGRRTSL